MKDEKGGHRPHIHLMPALLPVLLVGLGGVARAAADRPAAIRAERIRADITYLASDALAGRGSGTPGNEMAARYVAASFRRAGLKPIGTARQNDPEARMDEIGRAHV